MPAFDPLPPQRRDNGLRADSFVALADVDPRLGEHLLDLLRLADIPAYLEPPADPRLLSRYRVDGPIERLHVQSELRSQAREVVLAAAKEAGADTGPGADGTAGVADGNLLPAIGIAPPADTAAGLGSGPSSEARGDDLLAGMDTNAEFARIMAGFDRTGTSGRPVPPSAADAAGLTESAGPSAAGDADPLITAAQLDAAAGGRAATDDADLDDEVEHFIAPPPPPFPIPRADTVGALVLLVLGILVIARGDWLGLGSGASLPLGIILILIAGGVVVRGLREHDPDDTDPDDGAVV